MIRSLYALAVVVGLAQPASPTVFGVLGDRLDSRDQTRIAVSASIDGRRPWLLDTFRSQVLPETWLVNAYLTPTEVTAAARRGRLVEMESLVTDGAARQWRVTSRALGWAQVALPGRPHRDAPTEAAIDRPFTVAGQFDTEQLVALAQYVRSSPRVVVEPASPRTREVELWTPRRPRLDGQLPIVSIERSGASGAVVWVAWRAGTSYRATLVWQPPRWVLTEVVEGGIP
jgi:hypothetical protein